MNVYLVQHAQAKTEQEDPERPLSEKGLLDIEKVAAFIAQKGDISLKVIFHSGKTRARQTAEVLIEQLDSSIEIKETDGLKPLDGPSVWADHLAKKTEDIMLVGHLPNLSKMASLLLCQDADKEVVEFQMGGIVCLGTDKSGNWSIRWMVTPDILT